MYKMRSNAKDECKKITNLNIYNNMERQGNDEVDNRTGLQCIRHYSLVSNEKKVEL